MTTIKFCVLAATLATLVALSGPTIASPEHPELAEVMDIYVPIYFRNALTDDPLRIAANAPEHAARSALEAMNAALEEWGSGPADGWKYLMNGAVFAATGIGATDTFVMFYNPWVDAALVTEWRDQPEGLDLIDLELMPGDVLRGTEIHPIPAWQRAGSHPSIAMIDTLADTVDGFEGRFKEPSFAANWREELGLDNRVDVTELVLPLIALRVYEAQLRLLAITHSVVGEDPLLQPMREAVVNLVVTAAKVGFAPLLQQADRTPKAMAEVLAAIPPASMQGLTPVAYLGDDDEIMIYFASPLTADFALAAVFAHEGNTMSLRGLDIIFYAAAVEAAQAG